MYVGGWVGGWVGVSECGRTCVQRVYELDGVGVRGNVWMRVCVAGVCIGG